MQNQSGYKTILALLFAWMMLFSLSGCANIMQMIVPTPTPTATPTPAPTPTPSPTPTSSPAPSSDLSAFRVGGGDGSGYYSSYFGFGLSNPEGWYYYDRSYIDFVNIIEAKSGDSEAYQQEYIDRLKSGLVLYDYLGYYENANEMIHVTLRDYSESETGVLSEQEVLDNYSSTFFDIGGDGTVDARNIRNTTFSIGDTEHKMTRFEMTIGDDAGYGAIMAIPKDTMYAVIIILCPDETMLQGVIDSFYVDSKYPSIEEYSIPVIDVEGYHSKYLELSFQKPADWEYYSWDELIYFNQFNAKKTDEAALTKAFRDQFRSGDFVMEYCAFEKNLAHMAYIFTADSTGNRMATATNLDFFHSLLVYLLDFDHDSKVDAINGEVSEEKLLGQDCLVYRFDDTLGYSGIYGMVFCYQRGTTFVGIELLSGAKGVVDQILPLLVSTAEQK